MNHIRFPISPRVRAGVAILSGILIILIVKLTASSAQGSRTTPQVIDAGYYQVIFATATLSPTGIAFASPAVIATNQPVQAVQRRNCTAPWWYWAQVPDQWLVQNVILGNLSYSKADMLKVMNQPQPSLPEQVLQQFFTALLNNAAGVDLKSVQPQMSAASAWVQAALVNPCLSDADIQQGMGLFNTLDRFNRGAASISACPEVALALAPTATPTQTPTATPTVHLLPATGRQPTSTRTPPEDDSLPPHLPTSAPPTPTPLPSSTPAPTATAIPTVVQPSPTSPPTISPLPTQPPPTPTDSATSTPQPTNTPRPTKEPKPTHPPKPTKSGL